MCVFMSSSHVRAVEQQQELFELPLQLNFCPTSVTVSITLTSLLHCHVVVFFTNSIVSGINPAEPLE